MSVKILHIGPTFAPPMLGVIQQIKEHTDFSNVIISNNSEKFIMPEGFFSDDMPIYVYPYDKDYIERNVFLESKAYRSTAINSIYSLFGMNSMMNNWFTESQMGVQFSKFFDIKMHDRYVANVVSGNENILACWLCSCKEGDREVLILNDYAKNLKYIRKLPKK
jgi:hypothetical protein